MKWRQAQLSDKQCVAVRYPADRAQAIVTSPMRIQNNKWGEPVCYAVNGSEIMLSEADKYHDWQPNDKADTITTLGNVARGSAPFDLPPETPRIKDPLDYLWRDDDEYD